MPHPPQNATTVLLVEDEPPLLALVVEGFQEAGLHPIWAGNAEDALSLLEVGPGPAALVTDIRLPGRMNGWDLGEKFRQAKPSAPVIYVSGYSDVDARPVSKSIFLRKPYRLQQLLSELRRLLGET
jgi:DNA-binding NtrC family response regulator